jgi:elongation factor Ts
MAMISASMVKELREKTGAGMMDCKNALTETAGDIEGAIDWLRKKGLSKAAKKGDRVAAEGLIAVAVKGTEGVVAEVNSETDFVARNEDFQVLARTISEVALAKKLSDVDAIKEADYPDGTTVQAAITNAIATIGENMTLRRVDRLEVGKGVIGSYVHNQISEGLGKIGVIVALESDGPTEALLALGRKIAQHIAATNPVALDSSSIDPEVIAREKAVLAEKNGAGKPAHVVEKIVESGLKSYFKEVCLIDQVSIHADHANKTIGQAAKEAGAEIKGYVRYGLGEGIEKAEAPDFASEVAAAAGL